MEALNLIIVEDEDAHLQLMKRAVLKEFPGASIYHFFEAFSCLEEIDRIASDLIIIDYHMPVMNGLELLEKLRLKDKNAPVIMITGQGDEGIAVRALKLGAADFLVKTPEFFKLLPGTIDKVLREQKLKDSLRVSEKRFRDLANSACDWLWEVDAGGRFTYSNPAVEGILGYSPDEAIGSKFDHFPPGNQSRAERQAAFELMRQGTPISGFTSCLAGKNKRVVFLETSGVPVFDSLGRFAGYRGIDRDVTRRKIAEQSLRISEERFRSIYEKSPIGIMLFDECGMIVDANRASLDLLGMTDSASLGKFNIFDDSSVPERALEQLCKGQTIRYETRFDFEKARDIDLLRTPKSGVFFFDVQITPLMQNQIIGGYLLQVQDLTVRKRAEQALEISHQFLEAANRSATLSGLIESFAILARQFTGCSVVNIRILDEDRSTVCEDCESIEYESIAQVPIRFGDTILGLIHIADAKQKKQNMLPGQTLEVLERAAMELGTAIQRLRAAEELRRAHDELEMRVKERTLDLASSNDRLQKEIEDRTLAQEALSKSAEDLKLFAYSIMHDLKSPTIGLYGLTKLLHRQYAGKLDEKGMNYCEQILRASEYCSSLVDLINTFIAAKESPLNIETVKLNDILRTVIEEFSAKMSVRRIRCIRPDSDVEIRVDRLSMIRVLTNLVDNALKYGGDVLSEIRIGYEETDDYCILSVSDDGVGMNRKDCEEIFGPFQRSGNSAGITGTGLGLNIVREIAKRHRGSVQVVPEPERGMVFRIFIGKSL